MAFEHGRETAVYVSKYNLSAYLVASDVNAVVDSHDSTTYGDAAHEKSPGLRDGSATLQGIFDVTLDGYVESWLGSASGEAFTVALGGAALADRCMTGKVRHVSYGSSAPVGGMVAVTARVEGDGGIDPGVIIHTNEAETATAGETGVDSGIVGGTSNGGVAVIHCFTVSGTNPTLTSKLQHCADNATWADFSPAVAFTQLTAAGSERILIPAATAVARYVREYHTIGGTNTPTFTYAVALARR
ncbi:MAG: hypothetical protein V2A79_09440 [Planctomycetota bacterium]